MKPSGCGERVPAHAGHKLSAAVADEPAKALLLYALYVAWQLTALINPTAATPCFRCTMHMVPQHLLLTCTSTNTLPGWCHAFYCLTASNAIFMASHLASSSRLLPTPMHTTALALSPLLPQPVLRQQLTKLHMGGARRKSLQQSPSTVAQGVGGIAPCA